MYRKLNSGWIKHWDFELFDIICLELAFLLSFWIRHRDYLFSGNDVVLSSLEKGGIQYTEVQDLYLKLVLLLILFDILVTLFTNNYKGIIQRNAIQELTAVIRHVSTVLLILLLYEYIVKEAELFSRTVFGLTWVFGIVFCLLERLLWKRAVRRTIANEKNQRRLLLISSEGRINVSVRNLLQKKYREFRICAISIPESRGREERIDIDVPVLYGKQTLFEYIRGGIVDEVLIDTFEEQKHLQELIDTFLAMGVTVHVGMGFLPEELPNQSMERIGEEYVVTSAVHATSAFLLAVKRFMDIAGSLAGLVLTGIAFIFVAPLIKRASPGPVFFKQDRIGKNGRVFRIYKFRSMNLDAEEQKAGLMGQNEINGLMFKMENDPRIIGAEKGPGKGIGNFIRRTSIDELPQFWNVLKGDMSMVGTRPPTVDEFEQYELGHKIRLSMKPGITGLSQVKGRSNIKDFDEVVKLDTEYIERWSLGLDIKILIRTIKVVFTEDGAH